MSDDLISKRELEQHLVSIYRKVWQKEWFEKTFYETMKIRKELSLNSTLKKILLAQETVDALEAEYFSEVEVRIDIKDSETTATLYGIPVDIDDSIAPGNIGYVIEVKTGEQP